MGSTASNAGAWQCTGLDRHCACTQREKQEYCAYAPHADRRVCPHEDQERLLQHFLDRADNGSAWAANMLRMTPCDLWPFIKGRTLWVMGDSITQVCNAC